MRFSVVPRYKCYIILFSIHPSFHPKILYLYVVIFYYLMSKFSRREIGIFLPSTLPHPPENRIKYFMQIGDNLPEMSIHDFWGNEQTISISRCWKLLPRLLSVKTTGTKNQPFIEMRNPLYFICFGLGLASGNKKAFGKPFWTITYRCQLKCDNDFNNFTVEELCHFHQLTTEKSFASLNENNILHFLWSVDIVSINVRVYKK